MSLDGVTKSLLKTLKFPHDNSVSTLLVGLGKELFKREFVLGDQLSKKSLSLVLSEDLEAQKPSHQDDSKTPLMKEKEK
jgi:hypothetical protein